MDKNIFKKFSYGLYIVSTKDENTLAGCVVNTAVQITSQNPIMAVSINKDNYTNEVIKKSKKLAINVLSKNINKEIINTFGFYSSKDVSKYANVEYEIVDNVPVIKEGSCGYLIGDVIDIIASETHDIFLVRVEEDHQVKLQHIWRKLKTPHLLNIVVLSVDIFMMMPKKMFLLQSYPMIGYVQSVG